MIELIIYIFILLTVLTTGGYFLSLIINNHFLIEPLKQKKDLISKFEDKIFDLLKIPSNENMGAKEYSLGMFYLNLIAFILFFFFIYFQNKINFLGTPPSRDLRYDEVLHTITSIITNTGQIHIMLDDGLTHLSRSFVFPIFYFISGATGFAGCIVFIRSLTKGYVGNLYVDIIKYHTRFMIPLAIIFTTIFIICGCPNTFTETVNYTNLEGIKQKILIGNVAFSEAYKLLCQVGAGYFTINSAHPFANPSYTSNFFQIIAMLITSVALMWAIGVGIKDKKQGVIILLATYLIFIAECYLIYKYETTKTILKGESVTYKNHLGKELRFGIPSSSIFTAAASNASGATNSALESYHPVGITIMLFNLNIQSVFGSQGLGVIGVLLYMIITAYMLSLMIGVSPQLLGSRIEKKEIILSAIILLINSITAYIAFLIFLLNTHPIEESLLKKNHYLTQVLFESFSAVANNGSGLESLADNTPIFNNVLTIAMIVGWFATLILTVFLSESLAKKKSSSIKLATLKTNTILFSLLFIIISVSFSLVTMYPLMIIGPINETILNQPKT